ncbi:hypothetical protein GCM10011320_55120 [Neoroseomonas lacus]|uniref:Uncharacterized protein n=1 Tax=Neoroseomonas lacus TaxID=287609 RepID=A0A917NYC0_9PROT|nr:hypothetical protein GCM10011320_55120 [Neoroseomonas lacus]
MQELIGNYHVVVSGTLVERAAPCVAVRTNGISRARMKIGLATLALNPTRVVWISSKAATA